MSVREEGGKMAKRSTGGWLEQSSLRMRTRVTDTLRRCAATPSHACSTEPLTHCRSAARPSAAPRGSADPNGGSVEDGGAEVGGGRVGIAPLPPVVVAGAGTVSTGPVVSADLRCW